MTQHNDRPYRVQHYTPLFTKTALDDAKRSVTGLASAWALDEGGDVITRGAYAKFLTQWRANPFPIPLIDQHNYGSTTHVIGKLTQAEETPEGLDVAFEVLADDPLADAVWKRIKGGFIDGLSIGYEVIRSRKPSSELASQGAVRVIDELVLHEISAVIFPMNRRARVDGTVGKGGNALLLTDAERNAIRERDEQIRLKIESLLLWEEKQRREELARALVEERQRRAELEALERRMAPLLTATKAERAAAEQKRLAQYHAEQRERWEEEDRWDELHEAERERQAKRAGIEIRRVMRHALKGHGKLLHRQLVRLGGSVTPVSAPVFVIEPGTRKQKLVQVKVDPPDLRHPSRTERGEAETAKARKRRPSDRRRSRNPFHASPFA